MLVCIHSTPEITLIVKKLTFLYNFNFQHKKFGKPVLENPKNLFYDESFVWGHAKLRRLKLHSSSTIPNTVERKYIKPKKFRLF